MGEIMNRLFEKHGFPLSEKQCEQFITMVDFLLEYNQKVNLTAITQRDEVYMKHCLDSVLPLNMLSLPQNAKGIDTGTGAGFPAIPMLILRPDLKLTMLDSTNKKTVYLTQLCTKLFNNSVDWTVIHGRAEELGKDKSHREQYDFSISRAVANLSPLSEFCLPFVKVGGVFSAMKGMESELGDRAKERIETLGGAVKDCIPYQLPTGDRRHLIIIEKVKNTPNQYPRHGGAILKG